ncbi:MAG TPA: deoxyribonuclease HsdR [Bacteroidales bacterium]|nr:deoxyribonuclease HsdR [Bacteroidales bacterium]
MRAQKIFIPFASAFIGGLIAFALFKLTFKVDHGTIQPQNAERVVYTQNIQTDSNATDFTVAAERSVDAVVHVMTAYTDRSSYSSGNPLFDYFFGLRENPNPAPIQGSGSGVILTRDGFIVTNNHVIDNADEIKVILNDKRTFEAKLVGRDPSTDVALLKINAKDLPFIPFGNSDEIKVGQWVLAIGNPFNLNSTVTAGIVSAKARNIQIIQGNYAIESFIQTDAAVNPGNSGGALVNLKGELIGINTAIASRTGSYSGYSFAIPSSIAKKIVSDIIEFGEVQRAILGVQTTEFDSDKAKELGIKEIKGVYVDKVMKGSAAEIVGMKNGDVILDVNGYEVNSPNQLQEQISKFRPNQQVDVIVNRNNSRKHFTVTLRNMKGGLEMVKSDETLSILGATFKELSDNEKKKFGLNYGVQITELHDGKLKQQGVKQGYIITKINRTPIKTIDDIKRIISISSGGVLIEGVYPNGYAAYYAIGID